MKNIDIEILKIIHNYRNNLPVAFSTIDRILLKNYENFILNKKLAEKLKELEQKELIQSPQEQIGYTLTKQGMEILKNHNII